MSRRAQPLPGGALKARPCVCLATAPSHEGLAVHQSGSPGQGQGSVENGPLTPVPPCLRSKGSRAPLQQERGWGASCPCLQNEATHR